MTVNKIVFLKILIAVITLLIFLTLGGIVYALVNYKTTPKLFSRQNAVSAVQASEKIETKAEKVPDTVYLGLKKGEQINNSYMCGDMICMFIRSDFEGNKIIIFDPSSLQIKATVIAGQKKSETK